MLIKKVFIIFFSSLYSIAGSFIMVAGWNWYHLNKRPHLRFIIISCLMWVAVFFAYQLFKYVYFHAVRRFRRHPFWQTEFKEFLDPLFFAASLFFIMFFIKNDLAAFGYVVLVYWLCYFLIQHFLSRHPAAAPWLIVNRGVFLFSFFIFFLQAFWQYLSRQFYILDAEARFYDVTLFRAIAMSAVWLLGFSGASFLVCRFKGVWRYWAAFFWSILFGAVIIFWVVNIVTLYYSGLHFSPTTLQHLRSSGELYNNPLALLPISGIVITLFGFIYMLRLAVRAHANAPARYWYFYQIGISLIALVAIIGFSSLKNTPEKIILKSFIEYYTGSDKIKILDPVIFKKLEKFGLFYQPGQFYVAKRDNVFSPSSTVKLLPASLQQRPNIIIIFLESFSSRLTSVFNKNFKGLTPGLEQMAADPDTTIIKKYYNASTPTVTGLISQLCSFLPPTGHEEIQTGRNLQRLPLLCLPEILKQHGYGNATYITAVPSDFANKGSIFASMGTDQVLGEEELGKLIKGEPLAWGYSDHQMFPVMWNLVKSEPRPFLMMLSTVDTHPPFISAKDIVQYKNSRSNLLNSFHTTDDAFRIFWEEFKQSPLASSTIVIAVADHAVFPAAYSKDLVPFIKTDDNASDKTYYDENLFMIYVPNTVLPKETDIYSSGLDFTPTILQLLNLNFLNSFEGHSIFDDRKNYPNLLGMHELGLYINQIGVDGKRKVDYNIPTEIDCPAGYFSSSTPSLTLCDYSQFYQWKRQMFEEGRFWKF